MSKLRGTCEKCVECATKVRRCDTSTCVRGSLPRNPHSCASAVATKYIDIYMQKSLRTRAYIYRDRDRALARELGRGGGTGEASSIARTRDRARIEEAISLRIKL
jgi:hypothetical protein